MCRLDYIFRNGRGNRRGHQYAVPVGLSDLIDNVFCVKHAGLRPGFFALALFRFCPGSCLILLNTSGQAVEFLRLESGVDPADAFVHRRVRGKHPGFLAVTKQHVADFFRVGVQVRGFAVNSDFLQCSTDSRRVTRELDGGSVRQVFTLTGYGRFDPAPEKEANVTDRHQPEGEQQHDSAVLVPGASGQVGVHQHAPSDQRQ